MTTAVLGYLKVHRKMQAKISSASFPGVNPVRNFFKISNGVNWKIICLIGFLICIPLLIFYVLQISDLTQGSYLINSYEKQISKLADENKNLQVSFAESSFLGEALIKIKALNFQKVTSVKYIQIPGSSVAEAK